MFYFFNRRMNTEHFYAYTPEPNDKNTNPLNIPLRYQWNDNSGYCGSVSFITAGLTLGQYFSQYDMRRFSHCNSILSNKCGCNTPKIPKGCKIQHDEKSQLLLGVNDGDVADILHYEYELFHQRNNQKAYFKWVEEKFSQKNIIVTGVYENFGSFFKNWYSSNTKGENIFIGNLLYDHIVVITNITSEYLYIDDIGNYENYLIDPNDNNIIENDQAFYNSTKYQDIKYIFKIPRNGGVKDRKAADEDKSLPYLIPKIANYGISISGLKDKYYGKELIPLSIKSDKNYECPQAARGSNTRPEAINLKLTVTASNLIPWKKYRILKFNDIKSVTDKNDPNFNIIEKNASNNFKPNENGNITNIPIEFTAEKNTYIFYDNILSSDQAIYRCFEINS